MAENNQNQETQEVVNDVKTVHQDISDANNAEKTTQAVIESSDSDIVDDLIDDLPDLLL